MKRSVLCVECTLRGVPFEKVETSVFKDQDNADAMVLPRIFRSLNHMRSRLRERSNECKVFIQKIVEYDFGYRGPEYWVYCAYRI